ncbi:MAG: DUF5799 family protein [Haloarculaceae archaeon]
MSDSDSRWTDLIVGDRMQLDQEFTSAVDDSRFSRQQWGMIMTAVDFDVENADDAEAARLVADTSKLPSVMPELDRIEQQSGMAAMGGASDDDRGSGGGLLGGIADALGFGGGGGGGQGYDLEELEDAERLVQEYASRLQEQLEDHGRWDKVRRAAGEA